MAQQGKLRAWEDGLYVVAGGASVWRGVRNAHQIFFIDSAVFTNELPSYAAILCEHEQARGVDIEPPGRSQAAQLAGQKAHSLGVATPVAVVAYQGGGALVAVFGLATDVANGLVQQDGDLLLLLPVGGSVDVDAVRLSYALACAGGQLIDENPAAGYPLVGFAPRAKPQVGHAFVQACAGAGQSGAVCGDSRGVACIVWCWLDVSRDSRLGRLQGAGRAGRGAWPCGAGLVVTAPDVAACGRSVAGWCGVVAVSVARRVVCARGCIALCFVACPVVLGVVASAGVCSAVSPVA